MYLRIFVYGVMAHLILGWAFLFFIEPKPPVIRTLPPIPVKLQIDTRPPVSPARAARQSGPRGSERARAAPPATRPERPAGAYTDLIPKASMGQLTLPAGTVADAPGLIEGHQFKAGTSGTTKQNLVIDASSLSAALDVPLKARRDSAGMEAFLRIERRGPEALRIVALRGDPMLRAVIFENLQEEKVRGILLKLMDALEVSSLPITLQAIPGAADRMQDEMDFSWIGRRLIIRKSAPPPFKAPFGAITLPDEDAKKAIIRDRLEFERFQRSPAYRSAIQNYDVPTGELR